MKRPRTRLADPTALAADRSMAEKPRSSSSIFLSNALIMIGSEQAGKFPPATLFQYFYAF